MCDIEIQLSISYIEMIKRRGNMSTLMISIYGIEIETSIPYRGKKVGKNFSRGKFWSGKNLVT